MTVLAAETQRKRRRLEDQESERFPQAAVKIWKGALVALNTSGFATNAADTASFRIIGVATETVDNSAGAAGDKSIIVEWNHWELFTSSGVAATAEGAEATVVDNDTVGVAADTTNDVLVGEIVKYDGSNKVWVAVRRHV
jgi:hypothetical protein